MAAVKKPGAQVVNELIERGLREHHAGRLHEAKRLYEQALVKQPRHPDALHLLGIVALQTGDAGRAVALIKRATKLQDGNPAYHANLGHAHLALNELAHAHAAFRRAATLDPQNPQPAVAAANCLALQGSVAEAERALRGVVRRHPDFALAWLNLGHAVRDQGRTGEAVDLYRRVLDLEPDFADAHNSLGAVLHALEKFDEAEREYRRFLALQPDAVAGYCNLASLLIDRGQFGEAAAVCREGLAGSRESVELHLMLGTAHAHQGHLSAALGAQREAARLGPDNPRALWAYGSALHDIGESGQGLEWLERARALQPDAPDFHSSMAGVYLSLGELLPGWAEYEYRPARRRFVEKYSALQLATELPDGVSGRHVLLLREQGLGDELFFLRFAPTLKSRGAAITLCASEKLASILARVPILERVTTAVEPGTAADTTLLVGDLPRALGRLPSSPCRARASELRAGGVAGIARKFPRRLRAFFPELPPPLPLSPLPERLAAMKARLDALGRGPWFGVTWRAGTAPEQQRGTIWKLHKNVPLEALGSALRGLNGSLLALQRAPQPGEIERLAQHAGSPVHDFTQENEDLEAMLALLALVDEYIGVSNTNMHLRAGVARTARVLVPLPAEWRWMAAGDESPWFPGFRLYRQHFDGDWSPAFERLSEDLEAKFGPRPSLRTQHPSPIL